MRIAFLSNANSVHLKEWAEHCATVQGHTVLVLTVLPSDIAYEGVELVCLANPLTSTKAGWVTTIPRIRRELRRFRADLLIGYRVVSYGFLAALTGFHPLAVAAQREGLVERDTRLSRFCVRYAIRRADLINAWSPNIHQTLLKFGAYSERVLICSRGVDLTLFPVLPKKPAGPLSIVMTRALKPTYNVHQLVEAMAHVLRRIPDAVCEIAGDGPQRRSLERLVADLGLGSSVRLVGQVDRSGIVEMLRRAHVYVSTTRTDGLALSHFEAMAAGVFPVVTGIAANEIWIRDGVNGLLAPVGDAEKLAACIISAYQDHDLRDRVVRENRRMVERDFDRTRNLGRISRAYEEMVISHSSAEMVMPSASRPPEIARA